MMSRYLRAQLNRLGLCDETAIMRVEVALGEALANAIDHDNLEIGGSLRELYAPASAALLGERLEQPPYRDRRVYVTARVSRDEAEFTIRDEGQGFDRSKVPDPIEPTRLKETQGRSLFPDLQFMDEVRYNDAGTRSR